MRWIRTRVRRRERIIGKPQEKHIVYSNVHKDIEPTYKIQTTSTSNKIGYLLKWNWCVGLVTLNYICKVSCVVIEVKAQIKVKKKERKKTKIEHTHTIRILNASTLPAVLRNEKLTF